MNTNQELEDAPWGSDQTHEIGPILKGEAATENPRDFVALENRTPCGAGGRNVHVINRHAERQITVSVRTRWVYQNEPRSETRGYILEPGAEDYVGCTIPGPTGQRFDRDIVGARFSS
jgi:hypothetical protein